jgi:hypothetical protein
LEICARHRRKGGVHSFLEITFYVADPECLSRIRIFFIPNPGSKRYPHQKIKYFNPKKFSKLSEI